MEIKAKAVAKEIKSSQRGFYRGVKTDKGWLNVWAENEADLKPLKVNSTIRLTKVESYEGPDGGERWSGWLDVGAPEEKKPDPPATPKPPITQPGKIRFWSYIDTMRIAHEIAVELEPDDQGEHVYERSRARAAIVNTIMMAITKGEVELAPSTVGEPGTDEVPPPSDEDLPSWANG